MQTRIAALALVGCLLAAGCLGTSGPAGTDRRSPAATTARTCEAAAASTVDPDRESVTPSPLPERPDALTRGAVGEYVAAYERAYTRNRILRADTAQAEVSVSDVAVRGVASGFVVTLEGVWWFDAGGPAPGTATATLVHADGVPYVAAYHVTEEGMRRTQVEEHVDADPAPRTGTVVECWS